MTDNIIKSLFVYVAIPLEAFIDSGVDIDLPKAVYSSDNMIIIKNFESTEEYDCCRGDE